MQRRSIAKFTTSRYNICEDSNTYDTGLRFVENLHTKCMCGCSLPLILRHTNPRAGQPRKFDSNIYAYMSAYKCKGDLSPNSQQANTTYARIRTLMTQNSIRTYKGNLKSQSYRYILWSQTFWSYKPKSRTHDWQQKKNKIRHDDHF